MVSHGPDDADKNWLCNFESSLEKHQYSGVVVEVSLVEPCHIVGVIQAIVVGKIADYTFGLSFSESVTLLIECEFGCYSKSSERIAAPVDYGILLWGIRV